LTLVVESYFFYLTSSALNVDFRSRSPADPLDSEPVHAGVKEGYLSKKWLFIRCCLV